MSFDKDWALAQKAEPYQDEIYERIWGECDIERHRRDTDEAPHILDREFHIDVEVRLPNGCKLTGQEKALRHEHATHDTFTIEFYQDREKKIHGEFFNISAQFYLHGYWNADESGFCKWRLINMLELMTWLRNAPVEVLELSTRESTSRASFYYVSYNLLPERAVYATSDDYPEYKDVPDQLDMGVDNPVDMWIND